MAARWVGLSRPHNKKTAAHIAVRRTFRDAFQDCVHALGVSGVLLMAAALNFAMYPEALANVVGEQAIIGFVPDDQASSAASQPIAPIEVDETEVRLLAATVWGEARSEGEDGMRAVAHVMVNRIGPRFGEDLATVILSPKQFSVWNRGDPNRRLVTNFVADADRAGDAQWETAQLIAREVLSGQSVDPTDGALFYHTRSIRPRWSRQGVGRQVIGQHVFYADVPDPGVRDTPRLIDVAQYFGRGLRILNPTTRERVTGVIQTADAAATPTLNGVPITQINHGAAAAP
ncbi:MAG TPA: cell wall hydrolase [Candidatus Binatia bacterium]|nr:cell wall hydrolase [Candidatus Binatia bacterium]